ncbi:MAG TPA: two-component regulator propeller domain-containing protein [Chitinophagaceae bacterium]|nr:two-component regulator propeller domain-containing protein [Chitinophagaceae bacterium]
MLRFASLLTALLCCTMVIAQREIYSFSRLDIYNGLSHNQVNSILKDQSGFVWFGTMSGLNRYDSYSFKVFRNKTGDTSSINDNYIVGLFELPAGMMWVTTRSTIPNIYDPRTEKFSHNAAQYLGSLSLPQGTIRSIVKDRKNVFWFLYDSLGLYRHDPSANKTDRIEGIASQSVSDVQQDSKGNHWIVHSNGLIEMLDAASGKVRRRINELQNKLTIDFTYRLFIDNEDCLWLWTASEPNGVFHFCAGSSNLIHFNENNAASRINNNLITGIIQDARGLVWISTDHGGINVIDKQNNYAVKHLVSDVRNPKSLAQNSINVLYKDDAAIIWIGTYKQGINYLDENIVKFSHYRHIATEKNSLPFDDVNCFVEDKKGNLWIGANGGGLIYFDSRQQAFKQYLHNPADPNSISNNVIVSLHIDRDEKLWVGTYLGGLNCFDGRRFVHYRHNEADTNSIADDRVWEIFEDSKRNLWIGTLAGGLDLFDRQQGKFIHHKYIAGRSNNLVESNYISCILEDRRKNLWLGTANGIDVFDRATGKRIHYAYNGEGTLSNNNVIILLEDQKGRIWIGTREGLNVFDPTTKTFRSFYREHGLPDNIILGIVEDNRGDLWITTPNGLCNLVLNKSENFADLSFSVVNYDELNNLQGREFNESAAFKTRAGEIIVGGPFGFNLIEPWKITRSTSEPKIIFTDLQVLNKNIAAGEKVDNRVILAEALPSMDKIRLKYKENIFSIDFAVLDFSHGSGARYAYKLEGFNDDWVYIDGAQRRIAYTNLDPGSYVLKVKALNNNNTWSKEKTLEIIIDPPFWRTPLAFIIYALVIIAILLVARRITLERAHMRFEVKQQRREAERALALDRMKTKFFTNVSHEFRTPLSLIISPLDKIIKNTADPDQKKHLHLVHRNARRLLNLVNQLLDFRKMEVQEFKLYPVAGDIVRFIKEISYSFSDISEKKNISFDFHSNVDALEIYFDKDKVEKIMFNLLSNAYKYTYDNGKVWVNLDYTGDDTSEHFLCIEVGDTGIGIPADKQELIFERFFQSDLPESMANQGSGIGLAITKEFVKLHNGTIHVSSEPEKGTTFTVKLPARKINEELHLNQPIAAEAEQLNGEDEETRGKKKRILLVEDNEDFRFYLKDNLKLQYHVLEASNGKEGWEKARSLDPDLIVSDIMMPLMTGIELAQKIKADTLTAHIPIILLTAVGSPDVQLEGYQKGIADYITKPFTFEILASRIKNLLNQQRLLRKKFQKQVDINPAEITITPLDEQFMKQAMAVVEKNMSNSSFSVEEFSRDMFMSRVALYKKILSLTGKAPLEFIRTMRMKRAAQLLEKSGMSISEIAYEVGFNNPKTFSKYFKDEFHILPSQYLEAAHARQANARTA